MLYLGSWNVWDLIYGPGVNTWMWSSAIFHATLRWNIITAGPESCGGKCFSPEQAWRGHVAHYSPRQIFSVLTSGFRWSRTVVDVYRIINSDSSVSLKCEAFFRRCTSCCFAPGMLTQYFLLLYWANQPTERPRWVQPRAETPSVNSYCGYVSGAASCRVNRPANQEGTCPKIKY